MKFLEQQKILEEYEERKKAFKENSNYLYDMLIVDSSLHSVSHTLEWLPLRSECKDDDRFNTEYFLMGTHYDPPDDADSSNKEK